MLKTFLRKTKDGFTLIELILVLAIIALIASIILTYLLNTQKSSKDARIALEMDQIRKGAEVYKDQQTSYAGFSCSTTNPNINKLCDDINAQNGGTDPTISVKADGSQYCAYVVSASSSSDWYCVDFNGKSIKTTTNPSGVGYCTATTFVCP